MNARRWMRARATGVLALVLMLCLAPAGRVRAADPLPNIWIDLYGLNSTYLGQPVPVGAEIAAFDAQTGVPCGQFPVAHEGKYGIMPCYGDDGTYPGATSGHVLRFTINGAAAETEAISLNGTGLPASTPVIWDQAGSLWQVNLHARLNISAHTLTSSANPADLGQSVMFTTEVSGSGPNGEIPTGSVQFAADGSTLGTVALDAWGRATLSTASLTAGMHAITATYAGDAVFYPSTASLAQEMRSYEERCDLAVGTYDFPDSGPVHVEVNELGSLACLRVQRVAGSHPQAAQGIATGQYWVIGGTNSLGQPASGFNLTLTLPANFIPDEADKLCRYLGVGQLWDCAASGFDATGRTITRANVVNLSDWAVGDDITPNAIVLRDLRASAQGPEPVWSVLVLGLIGVLAARLRLASSHAARVRRCGQKDGATTP